MGAPIPGTPPPGYANSEEKNWALIAHFGGIFFWFIPSLVALLVKGNESPTVRAHALEALNFQITWSAISIIGTILGICGSFIVVGVILWIPRTAQLVKDKVLPAVLSTRDNLKELAGTPRKIVGLFVGGMLVPVSYALCLFFSVQAFGGGLSLAQVAVVFLTIGTIASAAPTPGGVGAVEATGLDARVQASTVSGNVRVSTSDIAHASSVSGSLDVRMGRSDWSGDLRFSTVSGDINLEFAGDLNADVEMSTVSGDLDSDWPMSMRATGRRHVRGRIGAGGRELSFSTVSGSVEIRRAR